MGAIATVLLFASGVLGQVDSTPPECLGIWVEPALIDTTLSDQTVEVWLELSDDLSGFGGPTFAHASFGEEVAHIHGSDIVSGDRVHGVYMNEIVFPRYSAYGEYRLEYLVVHDRVGNYLRLDDGVPFDVVITNRPVPEPTSCALLAAGMVALLAARKRHLISVGCFCR